MISKFIKNIFAPDPFQLPAHQAYVSLVTQARQPVFYQEYGVADTLDGRFDVIVLHMFLLTKRLENKKLEFLRAIWEAFFSDMDRSLREMGASDTGIGKRIKKMAQAFYGRISSYEATLDTESEFKESLKRNLYRNMEATDLQLDSITRYVKRNLQNLQTQDLEYLIKGELNFCS